MKKTALDFWVGLFVVLGFVALLFLALKAGNMSSLSFQADLPGQAEVRQYRRTEAACAGEERGRDGRPGRFDRLRPEHVSGGGHDRSRQAIPVSEGFVGEDPDVGLARRAVHRPGAGRRRPDAQGGRHHFDDAIGGRAREPDRAVPVQQGGGFGRVQESGAAPAATPAPAFPGAASAMGASAAANDAWPNPGSRRRPISQYGQPSGQLNKEKKKCRQCASSSAAVVVAVAVLAGCATVTDADQGRSVRKLQPHDVHDQRQDRPGRAEAGREGLRVRHAAAGARQRHELLFAISAISILRRTIWCS